MRRMESHAAESKLAASEDVTKLSLVSEVEREADLKAETRTGGEMPDDQANVQRQPLVNRVVAPE